MMIPRYMMQNTPEMYRGASTQWLLEASQVFRGDLDTTEVQPAEECLRYTSHGHDPHMIPSTTSIPPTTSIGKYQYVFHFPPSVFYYDNNSVCLSTTTTSLRQQHHLRCINITTTSP